MYKKLVNIAQVYYKQIVNELWKISLTLKMFKLEWVCNKCFVSVCCVFHSYLKRYTTLHFFVALSHCSLIFCVMFSLSVNDIIKYIILCEC